MNTLAENLQLLKRQASLIVKETARNETSLDVSEHKVGWLTCVKIEVEDVLWMAGAVLGTGELDLVVGSSRHAFLDLNTDYTYSAIYCI